MKAEKQKKYRKYDQTKQQQKINNNNRKYFV